MQPVFGRLVSSYLRMLATEAGLSEPITLVELGAGRGEMASAFNRFEYVPIEIGCGELPQRFTGIVFSNEFFDALPVDVIAGRPHGAIELRVGFDGERFHWVDGAVVEAALEEGIVREVQAERVRWLDCTGERDQDHGRDDELAAGKRGDGISGGVRDGHRRGW